VGPALTIANRTSLQGNVGFGSQGKYDHPTKSANPGKAFLISTSSLFLHLSYSLSVASLSASTVITRLTTAAGTVMPRQACQAHLLGYGMSNNVGAWQACGTQAWRIPSSTRQKQRPLLPALSLDPNQTYLSCHC
jgi:hypothetical protein